MMTADELHRFADAMEEGEGVLDPDYVASILRAVAKGDLTLQQMIELFVPEDSL